ncbi:hypothetical protein C8F01DRAFT_927483, partial [Mycena amicta]
AALSAGASCFDWEIVPNTADVSASCKDNSGKEQPTRISLGQCVGNSNGVPFCAVGGGADRTCVFSDLIQAGASVIVSASCTTSDQ